MMCAIVIGCSGAVAMSLIIRKKQVEKQRRQQVVVITVHKFSYLKFSYSLPSHLVPLPAGISSDIRQVQH